MIRSMGVFTSAFRIDLTESRSSLSVSVSGGAGGFNKNRYFPVLKMLVRRSVSFTSAIAVFAPFFAQSAAFSWLWVMIVTSPYMSSGSEYDIHSRQILPVSKKGSCRRSVLSALFSETAAIRQPLVAVPDLRQMPQTG